MNDQLLRAITFLLIASPLFAWANTGLDRPTVTWASDPVLPGETVMALGDGWSDSVQAEVVRIDDGESPLPGNTPAAPTRHGSIVTPLQVTPQSVKFVLPTSAKPGIFAFRLISGKSISDWVYLNRPDIWWFQGDQGLTASPGGEIRIFGKCLNLQGQTRVCLRSVNGAAKMLQIRKADLWQTKASLAGVAPGEYHVYLHNGAGGSSGWHEAGMLTVSLPETWKTDRFNVIDFGAIPNDDKDDTAAVKATLQKAEQNGGGIVYFPRGRYLINDTLMIPRHTVLQGEGTDLCALYWPDRPIPFPALIKGTNSFAVRDLTIYAINHVNGIEGDFGNVPNAGHIYIERVRIRADRFFAQITNNAEQIQKRLAANPGMTLKLGGDDVRVTDCDIYGGAMCLDIAWPRNGLIARNKLHNGPTGWYSLTSCNGLIFEDNELSGDEFSGLGGLNPAGISSFCQNVYFARNKLSDAYSNDREAMTTDAEGGAYTGKIASVDGPKLILAADPTWASLDWAGTGLFLMSGQGAGQYRRIVHTSGREVEVDKPWVIPPDDTTKISIVPFMGHFLFIGNAFYDTTIAIQFYGISIDDVVAGNRSTRAGGFHNIGLLYTGGFGPDWFIQYFDNEIVEGNSYSGPMNDPTPLDSIFCSQGQDFPNAPGPLVRASIFRRDRIQNNGRFQVLGGVQDALIENCTVRNSDVGIEVDPEPDGVLLRDNHFEKVKAPLTGSGIAKAVLDPAEKQKHP